METSFNKSTLITSLIAFAAFSFFGIFWIINSQNTLLEEYPPVGLESEIIGRIASKEISKSITRIKLEEKRKFTLPQATNYSYIPSELNNFVQEGDLIQKKMGSDTLKIFRTGQQYFFRLRKFLGVPSSDYSGYKIPQPQFDEDIETLVNEYKNKYQAKAVSIGRPFVYSSNDSSYWLKVSFLNPELSDKTFKDFGKEIATNIFNHLSNDQDFEKIEVSITQKKGFIITFNSSQNAFYYRDSLILSN